MKRNELRFQNHIIDSYARAGGRAQKWASEWQANKPDLICCLPLVGIHLLEVKHLPEFGPDSKVPRHNALTAGQQAECRAYREAGGMVWAAVVGGASDALGSYIALFQINDEYWNPKTVYWVPYIRSQGFDINTLIKDKINAK